MSRRQSPRLTLLLGAAGCGKTQSCIDAFEQSLQDSTDLLKDNLLFILPTAEHRARTVDLVLRKNSAGFFHRRITTFDRALKEFLKLGGFDFATDASRRALLRDVLSDTELSYFNDAAQTTGFLELIGKTVIELKENLITPKDLESKLKQLHSSFPEFQLKYKDLTALYERYEQALQKRGLVDQRDSLRLLEAGLKRGEFAPPKLTNVWIDGFSDFSKLQIAFIEFLTRHAEEVTITLTMDNVPQRRALFQVVSQTQVAIEDLGFKARWLPDQNYRTKRSTLKHVEQNIFRDGKIESCIKSDEAVQIFDATGLVGEIEMIAREIKRVVRSEHYHFSDIAMIFRATDSYESLVRSVLAKYKIPVEIHERMRLRTFPIARTLTSFFRVLLHDWTREDLFNFLKSSHVRADYELVCELELRAFQQGIVRDRAYWLKSFDAQLLKDIAVFEDRFRGLTSIDQFVRWVKVLMDHFGLTRLPNKVDEKTRHDRETIKRIYLLLEELRLKMDSGQALAPETFAEHLLSLIEVDLFSVHDRDKNCVQVYNVSLARQKEYKVVFLVGLLERRFPIQVREDPVLSDTERRKLNERGEILRERLPRQAFERYLFYLGATRASERLYLSYPRFDLEGKEALPSFYVNEVRRLFSNEVITHEQKITDVLPKWNELASVEEAERSVVQELWCVPEDRRTKENEQLALMFYNQFRKSPHFLQVVLKLFRPIEGKLSDDRIKPFLMPKNDLWSPTPIEEYAECPYRYFANHLLHLENQNEGIDLRRVGHILHDVLEHFFSWLRDRKEASVSLEEAKTFCLNRLQKLWQEEPLSGERWHRIMLKRREMEEMLFQVLALELVKKQRPLPKLQPKHFEYRFGFNPSKEDHLQVGHVRMRGIIDRIDVDGSGKFALVIDYKTGKTFHAATIDNKTCIQLPVYLMAVKQGLGLELLGGHLYSLSKRTSTGFHHKKHLGKLEIKTRKGISLSEQEFDHLLSETTHHVERYVKAILRAEIPVRPRDCVSYCPYSSVCRIEKWRLEHLYLEHARADQEALKQQAEPLETRDVSSS